MSQHEILKKETDNEFWGRQEDLLKEIKTSSQNGQKQRLAEVTKSLEEKLSNPSFSKVEIKYTDKKPRWSNLPRVCTDWDDWPIHDGEDQASIGEGFVTWETNVKVRASPRDLTDSGDYPTFAFGEEEEEEESEVILSSGIKFWSVIQPKNIYFLPNGEWSSDSWKPRVWDEERRTWRAADKYDCEHWDEIPLDKKRVNFCRCVAPDL